MFASHNIESWSHLYATRIAAILPKTLFTDTSRTIKDILMDMNKKDVDDTDAPKNVLDAARLRSNPFGKNLAAERLYGRTERVATALFLVTNHLPDGEPMRALVRRHACTLLERCLSVRDEMRSPHSQAVLGYLGEARHLISHVRLLAAAGLVSLQNAEVLAEALDELSNSLSSAQRSGLAESVTLSREGLMDTGASALRGIKDISGMSIKDKVPVSSYRKTYQTTTDRKKTSEVRVRNILEVVRNGGELSIREITANLPEYSEKMIQRELLDLVARGQVVKKGLKRWSRYSTPS